MSNLPFKCWKIIGLDVYAGQRRAVYFFCAQENTFTLGFTFYSRGPGDIVNAVEIEFRTLSGQLSHTSRTNVLHDGGGYSLQDASNAYQATDDSGIYDIQGDCSGCGCDSRTHCRIPCPNTALGYCCIEKRYLKELALLVREVSGNRR